MARVKRHVVTARFSKELHHKLHILAAYCHQNVNEFLNQQIERMWLESGLDYPRLETTWKRAFKPIYGGTGKSS